MPIRPTQFGSRGPQRPRWPFTVNRNSWQARGLVAWWVMQPTDDLRNSALRPFPNMTLTGDIVYVPDPEMGIVAEFDGTTDYFVNTSNLIVTGVPFSMTGWYRTTSDSTTQSVCNVADFAGGSNQMGLDLSGTESGDPVRAYSQAGSFAASSLQGYTINTWEHIAGVWASATSRVVSLNGVGGTPNTTNLTPAGLDNTSVGMKRDDSADGDFSGRLADVRVYNRALSDAEVAALYAPATRWDLYQPLRQRVFISVPAAVGGLSIPVAMHEYRQRHQSVV